MLDGVSLDLQRTNSDGKSAKAKTSKYVADKVWLSSTYQGSRLAIVLVIVGGPRKSGFHKHVSISQSRAS